MAYSTEQIAAAIAESVAQGFSVDQTVQAGIANYGISPEQAAAGVALYSGGGGGSAAPSGGGGSPAPSGGGQTYSDSQLVQAIAASVAQGFSVDQSIQGATQNYGVPRSQAINAAAQYLSQSQTGSNASAASIASQLNSGSTAQQIQTQLNQARSGQNFDTQALTSIYRQTLGRNPSQDEYQYFQSLGQSQGLSADQLRSAVQTAAMIERQQRGITQDFTNLTSADFEADPFGGRFATTSIYGIPTNPADQINISSIDGRQVQFVNPITQLAVMSSFTNRGAGTTADFPDAAVASYLRDNAFSNPAQVNQAITMFGIEADQLARATALIAKNDPSITAATQAYAAAIAANPAQAAENAAAIAAATSYTSAPGVETLSVPRITEAVNRAFQAGSLTNAEYSKIVNSLSKSTNPADVRNILATPQGSVVIDAIYGQQTGEDNSLTKALEEARQRQAVLTKQDPGYYQASDELGRAYQAAGLSFPFMSDTYKADTMMTQANALNPQNFNQKVNELLSSLGQQFGGAETMQTPQTGQYYSEAGLQPGFTPFGTEGTTFRSGVAGYIPEAQLPTRFDFGAAPVNATFQQYRPGAFQPAGVTTGGFITGYSPGGAPIYSSYANPNVNVGGVQSTLNPFTPVQANAIGDLQAQLDAINAARSPAFGSSSGGG
jgi:hypothetical protein